MALILVQVYLVSNISSVKTDLLRTQVQMKVIIILLSNSLGERQEKLVYYSEKHRMIDKNFYLYHITYMLSCIAETLVIFTLI